MKHKLSAFRLETQWIHIQRFLVGMLAILTNVFLSYGMTRLGLPLFFDTIGTMALATIAGAFPGIMVAVATNLLCLTFNQESLYFTLINATMAIVVSWFTKKKYYKKPINTILFIGSIALFSGLISGVIQWGLLGKAQHTLVGEAAQAFSEVTGLYPFASFLTVNTLVNIVDKGLSFGLAMLVLRLATEERINKLGRSAWMQRPLTDEELKEMKQWNLGTRHSIRTRISVSLLLTATLMVVLTSWITARLYFDNIKEEKTKNAWNAVHFVADIIDPEKVDAYMQNGYDEPGYQEVEDMLYEIRENASGVEYLYVLRVTEEGSYFIFDLDTADVESYAPGDFVPIEDAFAEYMPALLAGEELDPIESDEKWNWVETVYYPLRNQKGETVCYVGADVSLDYMLQFIREFLLRGLLTMAGFFILITAYALWTTGMQTAYPISTMAACVDKFSKATESQEQLDENVRLIRSLDIRTGDEVERLYHALCDLTLSQAEQMRDIRRLSDSTAKMQDGLIITMADMVENRDSDTGAHIRKTAAYVKIISEGLKAKGYYSEKLTPKFMSDVVRSAPLHDVGKINIPDEVLNKPGKLTDEEYEIMKTHTTAGKEIMENAISTVEGENYLKEARNMAAYHHERWDGKGYPEGLHGEVIPLSARIMAVADVFDALTSPRVYKPPFPLEKALSILQEGAGTQFDPKCVEVFMDSLPEVKVILKKYNEDRMTGVV